MKDRFLQSVCSRWWATTLDRPASAFQSLLLAVLVSGLFALAPQDAGAQTASSSELPPTVWSQNIGAQLAEMLGSPSEQQREDTLVHLIDLKRRYGASLDASKATPVLLRLADKGSTDTQRMLAITALYELRDPDALKKLAQQAHDDPPSRVRQHAARVLAAYRASVVQ